jgi:tetrahydromethanopterin S-methyltransferase subunit B
MVYGSCLEIKNHLLQNAVAFLKDADTIITSDYWRAVVKLDPTPFEDAIQLLHKDLTAVKETMDRTTPITDTHPVEATLNTLIDKVKNLKRFLPRSNRKRGLLDLGGGVL